MYFLIYFFNAHWMRAKHFFQAIQAAQKEHQGGVDDLNKMAEQVFQKAPPEICQKYRTELDNVMVRWRRVSVQLEENIQKLQDHMTKLQQFQARSETICWWGFSSNYTGSSFSEADTLHLHHAGCFPNKMFWNAGT